MMTPRRTLAFTLVEMLVATAVLSVMVVLLVNMLNHTGTAWTAGQAQTERRQSARAIADAITQDLQAALLPTDTADQTTLQFLLNPAALPADFKNPDSLFWQAPVASDTSRGDLAELGYFLKWDERDPQNPRPLFCRFFVNPTDTANYLIYTMPTKWLTQAVLDAVAPADKKSAYQGLFAENVIGFWARGFDKNRAILPTYDSRVAGIPSTAVPPVLPRTLRSVKIYLVLIDARALVRLRQMPDYNTAGAGDEPDLESFIAALPNDIRPSARSFTAEVRIQNSL